MHLFRTAPLVEALGRRAVSAEERASYLLASFLAFNVIYYSGLAIGTDVPWSVPSLFEAAAIIGINIFGVVRSFDASGGKSNPDYVAEFTCLYVPVAITTYGTVWGVYWLLRWAFNESILAFSQSHFQFAMNLGRLGTDLFGFLTLLANVISLFIAYERLRRLLARVREAKSDG
jgi:hypothetical protein